MTGWDVIGKVAKYATAVTVGVVAATLAMTASFYNVFRQIKEYEP